MQHPSNNISIGKQYYCKRNTITSYHLTSRGDCYKSDNIHKKERGRFLESVKVCVLRLKNSSRTIIFTKYLHFLLKRTIDNNFFLKTFFKHKFLSFYYCFLLITHNIYGFYQKPTPLFVLFSLFDFF